MDETHEIPCPTCGDLLSIDPHDQRPGLIFPCNICRCHLVLTEQLTFAHATNADLEQRPIGEQEVGRLMERVWSGGQHSEYC